MKSPAKHLTPDEIRTLWILTAVLLLGIGGWLVIEGDLSLGQLVAAEMIGAERGIGAFVLAAGNLYDTDNLLAGIVVLSALGLMVAGAIGWAERRVLRWR